ncbi:MAG: competence/damage-inducible protein A [Egibacteraceae bacterium]
MTARLRVSIIVIGDEILGGFVQDTNSGWLAGRLQTLGVPLDRIVTVPDEFSAIDEALVTELARERPRVVLTSGGIGSTPDDLTLEAVARHLGIPLVTQPTIDERISRALAWTTTQGATVTPEHEQSMRKMSRVPQSAYLLPGAEGVVPGIAVDVDGGSDGDAGATVVVLPGIPRELRRIMASGVAPRLLAGRGEPQHVEEVTHPYPESTLNPVLDEIVGRYPEVHLGSYPGRECVIRLKGPKERVTEAMGVVTAALDRLAADPSSDVLRQSWQRRW